jgi:hypothetical protein
MSFDRVAYQKMYYQFHKERIKERTRRNYYANRIPRLQKAKEWHQNHAEQTKLYRKRWNEANQLHVKRAAADYRKKIKTEVISHYSNGTMRCACCGQTGLDFLTLDHINNDGYLFRKSSGWRRAGALGLYLWLRKNNYPPGIQVFCWNCNMGRDVRPDRVCPHKVLTT